MIGIKFLFDLMAAKIAQIDSDFDWLNSTLSGPLNNNFGW